MSVSRNESTTHTCVCLEDPDLDTLRDLVARGVDQWEASRRLWGPDSPEARARAVRRHVREQLARRLPWLRLPREVS